ncbi:MAG: binding-protein-dependent transport system inner rane component [Deltaproteobacteria bacterium]|nr:binding-protein-dependent transport system inner rane component [Deltaproteobacteria bacterium]
MTRISAGPDGGRRGRRVFFYCSLFLVLVVFVFPFFWMAFNSFKTHEKILEYPPAFVFTPTLDNFKNVLLQSHVGQYTWNSVLIAFGSLGAGMVLGLPAAYGIARYGHRMLALGILVCRMIPGISFLVPWFIVFRALGLLDTYTGLVIAHLVITVPLITWIMIGFFEEVPVELEEAARIDGCSRAGVFLRIALPLVRPGLVSAAILALIFTWNSFLFPLILAGVKTKTLPVLVYSFMTFDYLDLGGVYAASTLVTLPVIVMVLLVQRQFIRGLTLGGVKG